MAHRHISGVVTPPNTRTRRIDDYAVPRKRLADGTKLTGTRWNRATPPVVRRITTDTAPATPETVARNTWRKDGLGPYSETRGRMFADLERAAE
jgi:hypothetical protein